MEKPPNTTEAFAADLRQQSKIVKVIEGNDPNVINEPAATISSEERESFLQKIADGSLDDVALDTKVIREIGSPFSGASGIARLRQQLVTSGNASKFLEVAEEALYGPNRRIRENDVSTPEHGQEEMTLFLERYPTPHSFDEKLIGNRLQQMEGEYRRVNDPNRKAILGMEIAAQRQKERTYAKLKPLLYGKRNEYWEQVKLLKKEAQERFGTEEEVEVPFMESEQTVETAFEAESLPKEETVSTQPTIPTPPIFETLSPQSAEVIRNQILERDLAYQDIDMLPEQKESYKQWVHSSDSAKKYAESLINASGSGGVESIRTQAREIRDQMLSEANRIGVPMSAHGKSLSWVMWDIGKQYHFFTNPEQNDPRYELGNPLQSESKREEILNRHIGWEAYAAFQGNAEYRARVQNDPRLRDALSLFTKAPKMNRSLSSSDLAELGRLLREKQ